MLSTTEKQNIVDEVFDFDIMIHLESGNEVYEKEDEISKQKVLVFDSNEGEQTPVASKTEFIRVKYNKNIRDNIIEYLPTLMKSRRILNPDIISEDTPQCRQAIRRARSSNGKQTQMDIEYIVQNIRQQHSTQYTLAVLQTVMWATMRNHIFYFKGKDMMTDFEIEIPNDYWTSDIEEISGDPLKSLLKMDDLKQLFDRDRKNPLEIQIAILTEITNIFQEFSDVVMPIIGSVVTSITLPTDKDLGDIDDAGFFRAECSRYLPSILRRNDSD